MSSPFLVCPSCMTWCCTIGGVPEAFSCTYLEYGETWLSSVWSSVCPDGSLITAPHSLGDELAALSSEYGRQSTLLTPSSPGLEPLRVSLAQMFVSPGSPLFPRKKQPPELCVLTPFAAAASEAAVWTTVLPSMALAGLHIPSSCVESRRLAF